MLDVRTQARVSASEADRRMYLQKQEHRSLRPLGRLGSVHGPAISGKMVT
jgi:hypothetical protein